MSERRVFGSGNRPINLSDSMPILDDPVPFKTFTPFGCLVAAHIHRIVDTGLMMPDGVTAPNQTPTMTIIATGPKCEQVKEGDIVYPTGNFQAINLYSEGGKVTVFREDQIAGVLFTKEEVEKARDESKRKAATA